MKNNSPLSLYNSDNPPKAPNEKSSDQPAQSKTPYLKAILSGTTKLFAQEKNSPVNPDREAALRYIKESSFLKKFNIEKMSC
jgi:hypothetical protein